VIPEGFDDRTLRHVRGLRHARQASHLTFMNKNG
jgi:hypothetical protein